MVRAFLPLVAMFGLSGCSDFFKLQLDYREQLGAVTVSAFNEGFFRSTPVSICPERVVVEELTSAGPMTVWSQTLDAEGCMPRHRWFFIPRQKDGTPLYSRRPERAIGVSIFARDGVYASSGWKTL